MKRYLFPILVMLLLILTYHRNFPWLWNSWMNNPNYSHGPLIPLVSSFLIWRKRHLLQSLPKHTDLYGLLICLLAIILHLFSVRSSVHFVSSYSLILLLSGVTLFLYGREISKALLFPFTYLIFMVPFVSLMITPASNQLKIVSSLLASNIVALLGIPILREGVILHLSHCTLEVADPCSGIRSLMTLLSIGALFAYFSNGTFPKKLILFFFTIPLAIISNVLRLLVLVVTAVTTGIIITDGFLHTLIGLFVFISAMAGLVLLKKAIQC